MSDWLNIKTETQKKIKISVAFWTICVMIDVCAHLAQTKADYEDSLFNVT